MLLAATGRLRDALEQIDLALQSQSLELGWHTIRATILYLDRRYDESLAAGEKAFASHSAELDAAVQQGGAEAGLRKLLEITGDWHGRSEQSWRRAPWRALLNDADGALTELETAYELRNVNLLYVGADPVYDNVRDHPRFQKILRGMGLPVTLTRH